MDIREFSNKLAEATKNMSPQERASLMKMFEAVSDEITKKEAPAQAVCCQEGTDIPDGMTPRLKALKENYLTHKPSITTYRARAITKICQGESGHAEDHAARKMLPVLLRDGAPGHPGQ